MFLSMPNEGLGWGHPPLKKERGTIVDEELEYENIVKMLEYIYVMLEFYQSWTRGQHHLEYKTPMHIEYFLICSGGIKELYLP